MKIVIVGTSHVGYETTQTLLKGLDNVDIHLFEQDDKMSFMGWGSQAYLEDKVDSLDDIHYANQASYDAQGVNTYVDSQIVAVDPDKKEVTVEKEDGSTYQESYDKLILSPGGLPGKPPVEGVDSDNIFFFRGRGWTDLVRKRKDVAKNAVIVGGGFIGIQVAEAYAMAGINTTVIDMQDRILPTYLDKEFTDILEKHAADKGITFRGGEAVQEFVADADGNVEKVITDQGEYEADTVILSTGVKPNTEWLQGAIDIDDHGLVITDDYQQSSDPDIYVAGDCTSYPYAPAQNPYEDQRPVGLATLSRRQGVIAAKNIIAGENKFKTPPMSGTSALHLFDYTFASTGVNGMSCDDLGVDVSSKAYKTRILPKFMDDDREIFMKIFYETDSHRIVGAQLMSEKDITQSINTMSVVISANMTLEDLALQDFFFQPERNNTWGYLNQLAQQALGQTFGSDKQLF